jgi:hypothetical protein
VLVAIGPLLRLYDLDDRRVIAERVVRDMVIPPLGTGDLWQDLVVSYDGRAFATSILLTQAKGEIRAFSLGADGAVGALERTFLPIIPAAALFPMRRALAIDSHGRQIAIDRIMKEDGKPNGTRRIAVINLASPGSAGETTVMETPVEDWDFNPVQMFSAPALSTTLRAAFSPDDQRLVTVETRPTCAAIVQTSQAFLPTMVPYCAQQTSTAQVWQIATGARTAQSSFDVATRDKTTGRQALGLGFSGDRSITQTALESTTGDEVRSPTIVTERIGSEDSHLIQEACARLPSDERSIRPEDWAHDFPGEPYRAICKSVP